MERPGPLLKYLSTIGVADQVEFIRIPNLYRSVFPGLDVTLPAGWEALEETLCRTFAGPAAGAVLAQLGEERRAPA